ncbi:hypothetical protein ACU18_04060 [Arthrobacter sp. ZBG10]|uniref:response regulator transcription factor n=1 Tax=Micrococcaceae TaxID=1268 RepID=UPI000680A186|nr:MULTISPECIES: response regulator transcription factor [Micrococcaceae]KNH20746.1 hypothetical protein ACU18_04060 [Arthrobacter sp. ZBG10]KQQ92132.1 hypothetical protein ASF72_02725 [Arthrobacter sp. Leaf141]
MRILLVDDDAGILLGFSTALGRRGHEVLAAGTVAAALDCARTGQPDIGVIDVMLPDGDGFGLCRRIAAEWGFPTVLLTARDDDADVVGGLEAGADDYVVKPVAPDVLEARLRAVLRRGRRMQDTGPAGPVQLGQLRIDDSAKEVLAGDSVLSLSATEFRLLLELAGRPGHALSRSQLIDSVWADSPPESPRVVDTTIQRLRAKLTEAEVTEPALETLRGIGYRLR